MWPFGYGSLMWDGWEERFGCLRRTPADLRGHARIFNKKSLERWGTRSRPGLTLNLTPSGACRGVAFAVPGDKRDATLDYLRRREQVTDVYLEAIRPVSLLDGSGRELEALCYVVDRAHPQYAGRLSIEAQARLVRSAIGRSGSNIDYVLNTVRHLDEAGIHDVELMALAAHLAAERG